MGPRWKGKAAKAKALNQPMSKTLSDLQSSLIQSNSEGLLSGSTVLLEADSQQTLLLNQACFGRPIVTPQSDKQWFQLGLEEALFLHHSLGCLRILAPAKGLWHYMCSEVESFPDLYKAYSHLRTKNWVVRPGSQYGVDYVAYRHHPALVHSEFAVLVVSDGARGRLRVWSDFHCTLRLCGSVAKTLLVMEVIRNNESDANFPACLHEFRIVERTVTRWSPQRSHEEQTDVEDCVILFTF